MVSQPSVCQEHVAGSLAARADEADADSNAVVKRSLVAGFMTKIL
jgi:hypothetical protein